MRPSGEHVAAERDLALAIQTIDGRGSGATANRDHFIETDGAALGGRNGHFLESFDGAAGELLGAHDDVVLIVTGVEGRCGLAGDQRVNGLLNVFDRDAKVGCAGAIDLHMHLRLAAAQCRIGIREFRNCSHLGQESIGKLGELLKVRTLNEELNVGIALTV